MQLSILSNKIKAKLQGDPRCEITGVAPLKKAKNGDLTFLLGGQHRRHLSSTKASAVVLTHKDIQDCPCNALIVDNPELAFANLLPFFENPPYHTSGIHPSVVIGKDCDIDDSATIAPGCVIGENVRIGPNAIISANTVISDRVRVGVDFYCYPNVTLYHDTVIGDRVMLHSGVVIGADGFGLTNDQGQWIKIPQVGRAVLGNDVEVGANTTIDRGALEDTMIGDGVKIDNQVQIAHNVHIGSNTVIAGCVGIAGSASIGSHCMIGGGACINGHITLANQVVVTGMAMVMHSIEKPGIYSSGTGLQTNREWRKSAVRFQQLDKIMKRLQKLEVTLSSTRKDKKDVTQIN